jgi:hypothetical protein
MLFIDIKYAKMVGQRVERGRLKSESPFHFQGRCGVCGDSRESKSKMRFHMRTLDDTVMCTCFNCGLALPIGAYMKTYEPDLFADYKFEKYRINGDGGPVITTTTETSVEPLKPVSEAISKLDLQLVSDMPNDSVAARYVASRQLPNYPFYFAENFSKFSAQYNPEMANAPEGPRLVIPFFDKKGHIFAYQGRDLTGKSSHKYLTVNIDKKMPTIFGIDRVTRKKNILIVEGPLDSLFLPNCIASVNAGLVSTAKKLGVDKDKITLIFDCEPRNKDIVALYKKALDEGYKVVIWPSSSAKKVDINDLVRAGKDPLKIINDNTYQGLMGMMKFNEWKKV